MDNIQPVPPVGIPIAVRNEGSLKLFSCPSCVDSPPMYWETLKGDYDWCVSLCCSQCNVQWCACTKCTNCWFKHITNQERHTKHHTKYHNGKKHKTPDIKITACSYQGILVYTKKGCLLTESMLLLQSHGRNLKKILHLDIQ